MIQQETERTKKEVIYTLDRSGREALSKLTLKFTKRPRTGRLIINVHEGRVSRVHFELSDTEGPAPQSTLGEACPDAHADAKGGGS